LTDGDYLGLPSLEFGLLLNLLPLIYSPSTYWTDYYRLLGSFQKMVQECLGAGPFFD